MSQIYCDGRKETFRARAATFFGLASTGRRSCVRVVAGREGSRSAPAGAWKGCRSVRPVGAKGVDPRSTARVEGVDPRPARGRGLDPRGGRRRVSIRVVEPVEGVDPGVRWARRVSIPASGACGGCRSGRPARVEGVDPRSAGGRGVDPRAGERRVSVRVIEPVEGVDPRLSSMGCEKWTETGREKWTLCGSGSRGGGRTEAGPGGRVRPSPATRRTNGAR